MLYLFQVIVYTGIMVLLYVILLRNKPMHSFNRAYLLLCTVLPVLIPYISLPESIQYSTAPAIVQVQMQEVVVKARDNMNIQGLQYYLLPAYCFISLLFLLAAIRKMLQLQNIIAKHEKEQYDGYILLKNTGFGPGSWRKYIFLPDDAVNDTIIKHEQAHINYYHSYDIGFITMMQILLWPNLFLIWIRKELEQVHEFQADAKVGAEVQEYAEILLSAVFGSCSLPFTHSFFIHPIKRRIMMLKKANNRFRSRGTGIIACFVTIACMCYLVSLQGCKQQPAAINEPEQETIYSVADKMPEFPGDINTFLAGNIKYPAYAKTNKLEGRVIVQFVVDKDGSIGETKIMNKAENMPDTSLCNEAIRAVNEMPQWIPGENKGKKVAVYYTLPVAFKLN